jgi:ABC-type Fe3+ transport system substrate-binding protein
MARRHDAVMTRASGFLVVVVALAGACGGGGSNRGSREVTAYVSADQPFSEPIMKEYERRTGVRVNVAYDTEETKSTGLANRLFAEKGRPRADVFWSNEPVRTLVPVMPNMVSLIANAPHPDEGRRLVDYLLSPGVERALADSEAVQLPLHPGVSGPKNLPVVGTFKPMTLDYAKAASRVEDVTARLQRILGL